MTIPRVVIGKYNDGVTFGVRTSLPGTNALTGDSSAPGAFSFDSEWTDIAQIHVVGILAWDSAIPGFSTSWTGLGYKPFVEARRLDSNVVRDDWWSSTFPSGSYLEIANSNPNSFRVLGGSPAGFSSSVNLLYIVYKIPVPSG